MLLPHPVGPTRATTSPAARSKLTPVRTGSPVGYEYETSRASTSAGLAGGSSWSWASGATSAARTRSRRSVATTARGISSSRNPTTRIGNASRVNSAIAWTTSPGEITPSEIRQLPTARIAMIPRFGSASSAGSKNARSRPTWMRSLRSSSAATREPRDLVVLEPERLDHQCAVEALVGDARDLAHVRLHRGRRALHAAGVIPVEQRHQGEEDEADEGQDRVDGEERDDREDDEDDEPGGEGERVDDLGGREDVGVGVGEQLTGGGAAVEVEGHREEVVRDGVAQPRLPQPRGLAGEIAPRHGADGAQHGDADDERDPRPRGRIGHAVAVERGRQHLVGDSSEHEGAEHRRTGVDDGADDRDREGQRVQADEAGEHPRAASEQRHGRDRRVGVGRLAAGRLRDRGHGATRVIASGTYAMSSRRTSPR